MSPGNDVFGVRSGDNHIQEGQLLSSVGVAGAEEDWDLQGVDVALFDSLFRGTIDSDAAQEETWAQWASNE